MPADSKKFGAGSYCNCSRMEEKNRKGEVLVGIGLSGSRKSREILRWAMEKFLQEDNVRFKLIHVYPKVTLIPTSARNSLPVSQAPEEVAARYREEVKWNKNKLLVPYQKILLAKKVKADIVVLESDDIAMSISMEVTKLAIRHLVIGVSAARKMSWRNLLKKTGDESLSSIIFETAADFCSVYAVAASKLEHFRIADSKETETSRDDKNSFSRNSTEESNGLPTVTLGRLLYSRPSATKCKTIQTNSDNSTDSGSTDSDSLSFYSLIKLQKPRFMSRDLPTSKRNASKSLDLYESPNTASSISQWSVGNRSSNSGDSESPISCQTDLGDSNAETSPHCHRRAVSVPETFPTVTAPQHPLTADSSDEISDFRNVMAEIRQTDEIKESVQVSMIDEMSLFPFNQLNDFSKQRVEEILKLNKENSFELTGNDEKKTKAAQSEATQSRADADGNIDRKNLETRAAPESTENGNKPTQQHERPVTQYQKFTMKEIMAATSTFSEECKIGQGAFGAVYKCKLHHTTVAIKILHRISETTKKQFLQELEILSKVRHPHLLLLLGAALEESCLVYEYMENGSLQDRLFQKKNRRPLHWYDRFRISWEVASALAFLHSTKPSPIVHRDLKPANILLDQNLVSKIGDAGLGTMIDVETSSFSNRTLYKDTRLVGTLSYIDPEYQRTGKVSTKSDLYALGVVILQLLTAQPASGIAYMVENAVNEGKLTELLDLEAGNWPEEETLELAILGLQCANLRGRDRPNLREVILPVLERLKDIADEAHKSATSASTEPPAHFICPIHKSVMEDPYVAADGYTYDRTSIEQWLEENNTSPTTNLPIPHRIIMPNNTLLAAINEWKYKN